MGPRLPSHLSTVVFDVGNTLQHLDYAFIADTITASGRSTTASEVAFADYEAKAAVDALMRARASGSDQARRIPYFQTILHALDVPAAVHGEVLGALYAEDARRSLWRVMHPRTPSVLAELRRRGFTLAVVSNADGRVPEALASCGIAGYFAAIIDSSLVGVEKPDPRIFALALEACGTPPAEAVYVGDIYEVDVRGARAAGLDAVLLDPLARYGDVDCVRVGAIEDLLALLPARG
jgi:HAD superfamily hydrolase (TIGR01509 family)